MQHLAVARRITVVWVPGHRGFPGNKRADYAAQNAADDAVRLTADHREEAVIQPAVHRKAIVDAGLKSGMELTTLKQMDTITNLKIVNREYATSRLHPRAVEASPAGRSLPWHKPDPAT